MGTSLRRGGLGGFGWAWMTEAVKGGMYEVAPVGLVVARWDARFGARFGAYFKAGSCHG